MTYAILYSFLVLIYRTYYVWPKVALFIIFNYIVLYGVFGHLKELKYIKDIKEKLTDKHLAFSMSVTFGSLATGSIGFGRPYVPPIIYFFGILVIAFGLKRFGEFVQ